MKKIAILHDHFLYSGGGERLVTLLAKGLDADLYTGFFNPDSVEPKSLGFNGLFRTLTKPIMKLGFRHFKMMYIFANQTNFLNDYEIVLFSGNCLEAAINVKKGRKIYYCHTPPRYLYDKYDFHLSQKKGIKKLLFKIIVPILRKKYLKNLSLMDQIVTNSSYVKKRLLDFTGYDSVVVYPPVDTSNFLPGTSEGFFLSYGRLTDIKRVHLIAESFVKMPNEKLVIIYNPSDPYLDIVKKICKGSDNIQLVNAKGGEIPLWVSRCKATIYIPKDEDFGMTPIESMSAGKPVIGVSEGGIKETVIDGKTGFLLDSDFEIEDICKIVKNTSKERCLEMKQACIDRAKEFDLNIFIDKMKGETAIS